MKINLISQWYDRKITELTLNSNHSLTHSCWVIDCLTLVEESFSYIHDKNWLTNNKCRWHWLRWIYWQRFWLMQEKGNVTDRKSLLVSGQLRYYMKCPCLLQLVLLAKNNYLLNVIISIGFIRHFQQYFSYILVVSFIDGGNRRNLLTCCKVTGKLYHIMLYWKHLTRTHLNRRLILISQCHEVIYVDVTMAHIQNPYINFLSL